MSNKPTSKSIGLRIVIYSLILIMAATLFPFRFSLDSPSMPAKSGFLAHLILFMPMGFGLMCEALRRGYGRHKSFLIVISVGVLLSLATEGLQFFLPRSVELLDALANLAGAILGAGTFDQFGRAINKYIVMLREKTVKRITTRAMAAGLLIYLFLFFLITHHQRGATSLENWDESFPLLIGNEKSGDRPWLGQVYHLQMVDKALSDEEIRKAFSETSPFALLPGPSLCYYQMTGDNYYSDESGSEARLVWRSKGENGTNQGRELQNGETWLESQGPVTELARRLRETSQFSLSLTLATAEFLQGGPARIVSFSAGPWRRNLTLGQQGSSLVVRLRTPVTGDNGNNPEIVIPRIFAAKKKHRILITYDGNTLRLRTDATAEQYSFELSQEAALFSGLMPLKIQHMAGYKTLYFALIFVPLGFFLSNLCIRTRLKSSNRMTVLLIGILSLSCLLEVGLALVLERTFSIANGILGAGLMTGASLTSLIIEGATIHRLRNELRAF